MKTLRFLWALIAVVGGVVFTFNAVQSTGETRTAWAAGALLAFSLLCAVFSLLFQSGVNEGALTSDLAALAAKWESEAAVQSAQSRSARVAAAGYRHAADLCAVLKSNGALR